MVFQGLKSLNKALKNAKVCLSPHYIDHSRRPPDVQGKLLAGNIWAFFMFQMAL